MLEMPHEMLIMQFAYGQHHYFAAMGHVDKVAFRENVMHLHPGIPISLESIRHDFAVFGVEECVFTCVDQHAPFAKAVTCAFYSANQWADRNPRPN